MLKRCSKRKPLGIGGKQLRFIEIRLQEGLLLLGSPGMFPGVLRKSSDDKLLASALRKLTANPSAMGHLRRNWLELGQRLPVVGLDDHELLVLMRREVSRGRLCAAMLSSRRRSAEVPAAEEQAAAPVIHLHHQGQTILIAGKGHLPHEFSAHKNNALAAAIIRKVPHGSPVALAIDKQASRLPGGSAHSSSGPQLRELIAWQIEKGSHEAVVLDHPQWVQKAAQLPSAPRPASQWSLIEKIREALRLSITHLPAELVNAAAIALIMEMGIALGALIAAQFVPGGGEVVDAFVAAVVYRIAGVAGLIAFWQIAHATYIAANANSEVELDEAGQEYAAGFVAIGLAKLAEIRAKLLEGKLGGGAKEAEGAGKQKAPSSKGYEKTSRSSDPVEKTQAPKETATKEPLSSKVPPKRLPHHRQDIDAKWYDAETGELRWPPDKGFEPGTARPTTLAKDTVIDRYGGPNGNFSSPPDTPFGNRALPYDATKMPLKRYKVLRDVPVTEGKIAPWFDEPGGGTQFQSEMTIQQMLDAVPPFLEEI